MADFDTIPLVDDEDGFPMGQHVDCINQKADSPSNPASRVLSAISTKLLKRKPKEPFYTQLASFEEVPDEAYVISADDQHIANEGDWVMPRAPNGTNLMTRVVELHDILRTRKPTFVFDEKSEDNPFLKEMGTFSEVALRLLEDIAKTCSDQQLMESGWGDVFEKVVQYIEPILEGSNRLEMDGLTRFQQLVDALWFIADHSPQRQTQGGGLRCFMCGSRKRTLKQAWKMLSGVELHFVPSTPLAEIKLRNYVLHGSVPEVPEWYVARDALESYVCDKLVEGDVGCMVLQGMTGTGKSALAAHLVKTNDKLKIHFHDGAYWIHVSDTPHGIDMLSQILSQLKGMSGGGNDISPGVPNDIEALIHEINKQLEGKTCLLVLDGINVQVASILEGFMSIDITVLATTNECFNSQRGLDYIKRTIPPLGDLEAENLFSNICKPYGGDALLPRRLIKECYGHPLALTMKAHLFKKKGTCDEASTSSQPRQDEITSDADGSIPNPLEKLNQCIEQAIGELSTEASSNTKSEREVYFAMAQVGCGGYVTEQDLRRMEGFENVCDLQAYLNVFESLYLVHKGTVGDVMEMGWGLHESQMDNLQRSKDS